MPGNFLFSPLQKLLPISAGREANINTNQNIKPVTGETILAAMNNNLHAKLVKKSAPAEMTYFYVAVITKVIVNKKLKKKHRLPCQSFNHRIGASRLSERS